MTVYLVMRIAKFKGFSKQKSKTVLCYGTNKHEVWHSSSGFTDAPPVSFEKKKDAEKKAMELQKSDSSHDYAVKEELRRWWFNESA